MITDAFDLVPELRDARAAAGRMLLGLDFDGTLAPIVPRPGDAALPDTTRPLLERLAARPDTTVALVSGRGIDDLQRRVGLDGVFYAGNHGLEIEGPGVHRVHPEAAGAAEALARLLDTLRARFAAVPGVIVEDKGLTASVHYRLVDGAAAAARVRDEVHGLCRGTAGIRCNDGRKVVEIRPDVDWHKGRALAFLRDTLAAGGPPWPTAFIGDDRTDEDAFRVLGQDGWSIVVGHSRDYETVARAVLDSPGAVAGLLQRLL